MMVEQSNKTSAIDCATNIVFLLYVSKVPNEIKKIRVVTSPNIAAIGVQILSGSILHFLHIIAKVTIIVDKIKDATDAVNIAVKLKETKCFNINGCPSTIIVE